MQSNSTDVWGPPLWRILHTLAERLGKQTTIMQANDEKHAWVNFLKSVETVIPCPKCKNHYKEWCSKNRTENLLITPYVKFKEDAKKWLWSLHTEINEENRVNNVPYSELENMYANRLPSDVTNDNKDFTTVMIRICSFIQALKRPLHIYQISLMKIRLIIG